MSSQAISWQELSDFPCVRNVWHHPPHSMTLNLDPTRPRGLAVSRLSACLASRIAKQVFWTRAHRAKNWTRFFAVNGAPAKSGASDNRDHRDQPSDDVKGGVRRCEHPPHVMAGLVPAIPIGRARRLSHRDHRDKPGDDGVVARPGDQDRGPSGAPLKGLSIGIDPESAFHFRGRCSSRTSSSERLDERHLEGEARLVLIAGHIE